MHQAKYDGKNDIDEISGCVMLFSLRNKNAYGYDELGKTIWKIERK